MFSKMNIGRHGRGPAASVIQPESNGSSVIGDAARVTGDLTCLDEIEVQGRVEGTIRGRRVTVGRSGLVEGRIFAESVFIHGSVRGPVIATSVAVGKTARIIGNITHNELSIEPGAYLEGRRPWRPRPLENRESDRIRYET